MDIDVRNAYNEVAAICGPELNKIFFDDIYSFIFYISSEGAEERFNLFCNVYLSKENQNEKYTYRSGIPQIIKVFEAKKPDAIPSVISFFTILGTHYLVSHFDRKSIDKEKYIEYIQRISATKEKAVAPEQTLEELLEELHSLIGLNNVKAEVDQMINLIRLQKKGEEFGEKTLPLSYHLVFYGNPGTGKTTVARLLAKIYKALGVLSKGHLVEVDRGRLVGGYVGQTAIKTQEVIEKAMGGILFIDEAYSLTHGKNDSDYGQEAVDTIIKAMEDYREDFIVIVAGYPELMKEFISSNPGLKSRFNQYINFEDYTPEQLKEIFLQYCDSQNLILDEECEEYLLEYMQESFDKKTEDHANGREIRNYFEKVVKMRANRLSPILDRVTKEEYLTIVIDDLINAAKVRTSDW